MTKSQLAATTHVLIAHQLVVYRRERSSIWQCRFSVDGRWQRTSTGERDLRVATARAHEILIEANVKKRMNVAPITRKFKDIATVVVNKLKSEIASGHAKAIYKLDGFSGRKRKILTYINLQNICQLNWLLQLSVVFYAGF